MIVYLREKGLRVHHYLNDILLLADNQQSLVHRQEILISTIQQFGIDNKLEERQPATNSEDGIFESRIKY